MRGKHHVAAALLPNPAGDTAVTQKARFADSSVTRNSGVWASIVALIRRREPDKTAFLIAEWTGHSLRTVRRWMAGRTVPGADVTFDLITKTGHGPAIIELIARSLPPKERAQFFRDLMKVAERAELQTRLEALGE